MGAHQNTVYAARCRPYPPSDIDLLLSRKKRISAYLPKIKPKNVTIPNQLGTDCVCTTRMTIHTRYLTQAPLSQVSTAKEVV
jgi:hypothetical protein